MTTPRARHRSRPPQTTAPALTVAPDEAEPPHDTARMRKVIELTTLGRTQAEIGAVLGCTDRTVRNILKAGRSRQVATFRSRSAEAILADVEHRAATQYARWTATWARARATGDLKLEAFVLSRMDHALIGRVAMLARVGVFDNFTFNSSDEDVSGRSMRRDREQISALVALSAALNRGEDIENVDLETSTTPDDSFDVDDPLY